MTRPRILLLLVAATLVFEGVEYGWSGDISAPLPGQEANTSVLENMRAGAPPPGARNVVIVNDAMCTVNTQNCSWSYNCEGAAVGDPCGSCSGGAGKNCVPPSISGSNQCLQWTVDCCAPPNTCILGGFCTGPAPPVGTMRGNVNGCQ